MCGCRAPDAARGSAPDRYARAAMPSDPSAAPRLPITGDDEADRLLDRDPLALLIGMLLDQQVPMEWAFAGPATLHRRLGHLDAHRIAALEPEVFVAVCSTKPAIHRYPGSMGARIHALCTAVADEYGGHAERIWNDAADGADLLRRLRRLPGYGEEKSRILVAILAKRFGIRPSGWREAAGPFGDDEPRSVADVADAESLAQVRAWKKMMKSARKTKQDSP